MASRESMIYVLTLDTQKFSQILQRHVELMAFLCACDCDAAPQNSQNRLMAVSKVMPMKLLLHHLLHKTVNIIKNN